MINAKAEFLKHVRNPARVVCAEVYLQNGYDAPVIHFTLKLDYDSSDREDFLEALNFLYDNGYGGQRLFGTIWYADGTWSDRGEYDGSEWWDEHICPPIPDYL